MKINILSFIETFSQTIRIINKQKSMARKKYDVLSPDGFSIHPTDNYTSKKKAREAAEEWVKRYKAQGYYSSARYGRIHLSDILDYCQLVEV